VTGLPPGAYRLRFPASLDAAGNVVPLEKKKDWKLAVKGGRVTEAEIVLKHVNTAAVAAGVVGVVLAAVLLDQWLDGHDLRAAAARARDVVELFFSR
jgi:hypothetical protein